MPTPQKPAIVDGSNARLYRMLILARHLELVKEATLERLQALMTIKFGLKRRTTTEMVADMENAHLLSIHSKAFSLTPAGKKWLKTMAKQPTL